MPGTAFRETADVARPFPVRSRGRGGEAEGNGKSDGLRPRRLRPSGRGGRRGREKTACDRYDDYDATEVPYTVAIPSDYGGVRGVPVSFLDRYRPEQFEILGRGGDILWSENGCDFYTPPPGDKAAEYRRADRTWRSQNPYLMTPEGKPATIYQRLFIRKVKQST